MNSSTGTSHKELRSPKSSQSMVVVALFVGLAASQARAELRIDCNSDLLRDIEAIAGPDLNQEIYGVRARDWQPETVDQWQRQALACVDAHHDWADSLKDSMRQAVRATTTRIKATAFEQRKDALRAEAARQMVRAQRLSQVTLYGNGQPQEIKVDYRDGQLASVFSCSKLKQGIGFATVESYRQAAAFAQLCVDAGQLDTQSAAALNRQAGSIAALNRSLDTLSAAVDSASKKPVTEAVVKDLKAQTERLKPSIAALGGNADESPLSKIQSKIDVLQRQVDAKACEATYAKTGMPDKWRRNYLLVGIGPGDLESLSALVCRAADSGAQVRYLSGGFLSKEGFEVRSSKRTVQIFPELQFIAGADPAVKRMVPVQAQAFGKKIDINRGNMQAVIAELAAAMANK